MPEASPRIDFPHAGNKDDVQTYLLTLLNTLQALLLQPLRFLSLDGHVLKIESIKPEHTAMRFKSQAQEVVHFTSFSSVYSSPFDW